MHNTFFRSLSIAHRVSCPHAHQQNGSAERKHRHIVETGLALLAHAHMPLKFWSEAFLTAAFLINRIPTDVIDNTCPLERLFHKSPNYSMLRVFGCACWPHLHPYWKKKTDTPKAEVEQRLHENQAARINILGCKLVTFRYTSNLL
jgi:hypothetical protein